MSLDSAVFLQLVISDNLKVCTKPEVSLGSPEASHGPDGGIGTCNVFNLAQKILQKGQWNVFELGGYWTMTSSFKTRDFFTSLPQNSLEPVPRSSYQCLASRGNDKM